MCERLIIGTNNSFRSDHYTLAVRGCMFASTSHLRELDNYT